MNLLYRDFKGMVPRYDRHLIGGEYAELALDVNLWHGTLKPFRETKLCHSLKKSTKSVFYDGCCWKEFDKCVDFTRLNTSCQRQVVTGLFDYPATACSDECEPKWIRLGVPTPMSAPNVEVMADFKQPSCGASNFIDGIDYDRTARTYVYTYVNSCCDEGAPSFPSEVVDIDDGGTAILSGFETPPPEYGVEKIRIYRLVSGFDAEAINLESVMIGEKSDVSEFFLVAEIPVNDSTYLDSKRDYELGSVLETKDYLPPPKELEGVITVGGTQLAGFYGKHIRFSLPHYPHVWEDADELTVHDNIKALVEFENNVIVLTCGAVYLVEPIADCKTVGCRQVHKTLENYPLLSCCGGHGYTKTPKGVVFVTAEGLILTDGKSAQNITSPYFAQDDWRALHPDRMSVAYHRDGVYFFSDVAAYCLQFNISLADWQHSKLVQLSDRPLYAFSADEELYLVYEDGVYRWNVGDKLRPYVWRGKVEVSPTQVNFAGAKVSRYNGGDVKFKLTGDGILIKEYNPLKTEKFRLPSGRRDVEFQVELTGTAEVYQVEVSTSYHELGTV